MLLTGDEIIKARRDGEIVIDPFVSANVNSHSYDVSLGPFYYRQQPDQAWWTVNGGPPQVYDDRYNPYDKSHVEGVWELKQAVPASRFAGGFSADGIGKNDLVIPIGPKEIILAHTLEFIGSVPKPEGISITTMMHSRSSSVRNCIDVCGSGGFGDAGFFSRWTMEIINHSPHYTCCLVVGRRIAQISFHRTSLVFSTYKKLTGKYQSSDSLAEVKRSWTPEMMLPRMYQDREVGQPNRHRKLINQILQRK